MSPLRVAFTDFGRSFDPEDHLLLAALAAHRDVEVAEPEAAETLFFGVFGDRHRSFVGTKVHWTGENRRPPSSQADFFIGFDHVADPRYLRVPTFAFNAYTDRRRHFDVPEGPPWADREFCNFIYAQPGTPMRRALFGALSAYRPVTSPGAVLNNASAPELTERGDRGWRHSKILYQAGFRFTIACENSSFPGYSTEKLYDALLAGTIPIYWGNPRVGDDFDSRAFVHCRGPDDIDAVVDEVRRIDADPDLAATYLQQRDFLPVAPQVYFERLVAFLDGVVEFSARARRGPMRARAARLRTTGVFRVRARVRAALAG